MMNMIGRQWTLLAVSVAMFILGEASPIAASPVAQDGAQQGQAEEQPVEATSLLGQPLRRREFTGEEAARLLQNLEAAEVEFAAHPDKAESFIWMGRRLAYLWRYNDAVAVFTKGIEQHPQDARLYRHRGHRYITLRKFEKAIADLQQAAELIAGTEDEVEADGQPNAAGIPTSTLHTNVYYHLGLAYYLTGKYEQALAAYEKCLAAAKNNDMRVATLDWMWMTLQKLGRSEDASQAIANVTEDMEILENRAYHRRLLMYQGKLQPSDLLQPPDEKQGESSTDDVLQLATYGYSVGNWYALQGHDEKAREVFRKVISGEHWAAFGFIASEADLAKAGSENRAR